MSNHLNFSYLRRHLKKPPVFLLILSVLSAFVLLLLPLEFFFGVTHFVVVLAMAAFVVFWIVVSLSEPVPLDATVSLPSGKFVLSGIPPEFSVDLSSRAPVFLPLAQRRKAGRIALRIAVDSAEAVHYHLLAGDRDYQYKKSSLGVPVDFTAKEFGTLGFSAPVPQPMTIQISGSVKGKIRLGWLRGIRSTETGLFLMVVLLLLVLGGVAAFSLDHDLDSETRLENYQRRGLVAEHAKDSGHLMISGEPRGHEVQFDLHRHLWGLRSGIPLVPVILALTGLFLVFNHFLVERRFRSRRWRDHTLLPLALLLSGLGLIVIVRLTLDIPGTDPRRFFPAAYNWAVQHAFYIVAGFAAALLTVVIAHAQERRFGNWFETFWRRRGPLGLPRYHLLLLVIMAIFVVTRIMGTEVNGAFLAVRIGGRPIQIIELTKLLLVIYAAFLVTDARHGGRWSFRWPGYLWRVLVPAGLVTTTALVCTDDMGVALIMALFWLAVILIGTGELSIILLSLVGLAGCVVFIYLEQLSQFNSRIAGTYQPFVYSEALAAVRWAIVAGGPFGTGLGYGQPYLVQNSDTDFILATIAEELGFFGVTIVLLGLGALFLRGFFIAAREDDPLRKLLATGAITMLTVQTLVITGGVLGCLPLTGLPLPFIARGGAGMIINFILLGILLQVSFVYERGQSSSMIPYLGLWEETNSRLRTVGLMAAGIMLALVGWAGYLMLERGDRISGMYYTGEREYGTVQKLIKYEALAAVNGRVTVQVDRLQAAADNLSSAERSLVKVSRQTFRGHSLERLASVMSVRGGRPNIAPTAFRIINPRLPTSRPLDILTRSGEVMATTRRGRRHYPFKDEFFPVTGYNVASASRLLESDALQLVQQHCSRGLPLKFDWSLIGRRLKSIVQGGPIHELHPDRPLIRTTIDLVTQRDAMDQLAGRKGAIVALHIPTGDILALASRPAFDPDRVFNEDSWNRDLSVAQGDAGTNRAVRYLYPPGSVFKLVTAAAILEFQPDLATEIYSCQGYSERFDVRDAIYRRNGRNHGEIDLTEALARSCNLYFAEKAVALGDDLAAMAHRLGLNEPIELVPGIAMSDLRSYPCQVLTCFSIHPDDRPLDCENPNVWESAGVSRSWYDSHRGLVARAGFGQSVVEVTPLHMALVTAAIANRGMMPEPRLIGIIQQTTTEGDTLTVYKPRSSSRSVMKRSTAERVLAGMIAAYDHGTASRSSVPHRLGRVDSDKHYVLLKTPEHPVPVAAKTGTAQVEGGKSHAWFVAAAPADNPQVAVAVVLEGGGSGARAGIPALSILRHALRSLARAGGSEGEGGD